MGGGVEGGEVVVGVTGEGIGSTETSKHGPYSRDCFSPAVTSRHRTRPSKEIANYGDVHGETEQAFSCGGKCRKHAKIGNCLTRLRDSCLFF